MLKRVVAILNFTKEDEAEDFYRDCELALAKSETIVSGEVNEERSIIQLQECHHDEYPQVRCVTLKMDETPSGKL